MSVYKEELYELKALAEKQVRIYEDACDYGILATPELKLQIKRLLRDLPDMRVAWKSNSPYVQRTYESIIYWESGEPTSKVKISIHYVNDTSHKKEYFSIGLL